VNKVSESNFFVFGGVNYLFRGNSNDVPSVGNGITIDGKLIIDVEKRQRRKTLSMERNENFHHNCR
jgi:hypothetical protein